MSELETIEGHNGMKFVKMPIGSFFMGGKRRSLDKWRGKPESFVKIEDEFWMATTPVTIDQFHYRYNGDSKPVTYISYYEALSYIRTLNSHYLIGEDLKYRLPSEAEWEYAARGGVHATRKVNLEDYAVFERADSFRGKYLHPVASKRPNGYGLYDMLGNVWEFCADDWHDSYQTGVEQKPRCDSLFHVVRGGSYCNLIEHIHIHSRCQNSRSGGTGSTGFRLVLSV